MIYRRTSGWWDWRGGVSSEVGLGGFMVRLSVGLGMIPRLLIRGGGGFEHSALWSLSEKKLKNWNVLLFAACSVKRSLEVALLHLALR